MFRGRHFDRSVILLCECWYLAYGLSLRDLKEMVAERGITVDHSTIHRWVLHLSPLLPKRFNRRKRAVTGKWHMDEPKASAGRYTIDHKTTSARIASRASNITRVELFLNYGRGQISRSGILREPIYAETVPVQPQEWANKNTFPARWGNDRTRR